MSAEQYDISFDTDDQDGLGSWPLKSSATHCLRMVTNTICLINVDIRVHYFRSFINYLNVIVC